MIAPLLLAAALAASPGHGASPGPALGPGAGNKTCYNLGHGGDAHYYPISDRTILVSAGLRAYRIETTPSPALAIPSSNLQVRGSGIVCSPLDLQLSVAGPGVGRSGLIVQSISPLSRAEAEELRKGQPKRSVLRSGG